MGIEWNYLQETFFHVGNIWGQAIVYLIMALFILGTIVIYSHFVRIFREKHWLHQVQQNFKAMEAKRLQKEDPGIGEQPPELPKTRQEMEQELLHAKDELQSGIPSQSIIAHRIENLFKVRYVGHLTCDTFKEILYTEELERGGLSRYLTGSFILLGLIGTVMGLSQSVIQMQPMLAKLNVSADFSEIAKALTQTLAGMRTAFSATIAGILATVLMAFFNFLYGKYATDFLTNLENFTTVRLIPHFLVPATEEAAIKFTDSMSKTADALGRTADPLEKLSQRFEVSVSKIETFSNNLKGLGEQYTASVAGLAQAQVDLLEQQKQSRQEAREVLSLFEKTCQQFQGAVDTLVNNSGEALRGVAADSIAAAQETNKDLVAETHKLIEEYKASLSNLTRESKDGFDKVEKQVLEHISLISDNMQKSVRQTMDELFKDKVSEQKGLIAKHDEISKVYADLVTAEREKLQNIMKLVDLSSFMLDKNHYVEMREREKRLMGALETLGQRVGELAAEIGARWETRQTAKETDAAEDGEPKIIQ